MTRVLVVWEDEHWRVLDVLTRRLVSTSPGQRPDGAFPTILGHTTEGNGRFAHYVGATWPRVRPAGLPTDRGTIDHLVCVLDGDRAHELVPAIAVPPKDAAATPTWHASAEAAWTAWLRQHASGGGPPATTVHGVVLRWAKESVVLAGYDQPAATHLEFAAEDPEVTTFLSEICQPDPRSVSDAAFADTFHRPRHCVDALRKVRKLSPLAKNAPAFDDAIRDLTRQSLSVVRARVPDLARLAELIWTLHRAATGP